MVTEYCTKADEINLAAQSLLRYVCDILREYNTRSHYLVLQAKAISKRTGLKKITCTNLVLSLRALQLLLWIVPYIQTHFYSKYLLHDLYICNNTITLYIIIKKKIFLLSSICLYSILNPIFLYRFFGRISSEHNIE